MNGAHIGDVVISTSVLPILRKAYPGAQFGFLTGSWSSVVVKDHPEIAFIHEVDHWRLNRSNISFFSKFLRSLLTSIRATREIRAIGYDIALSLHCWYPDFTSLAWRASIPVRVAYSHSWFAPFATDLAPFPQEDFVHQSARISRILLPLPGIKEQHLSLRHAVLQPSTPAAEREMCDLLEVERLASASYIIIHIGSGEPGRELPADFWRKVAAELSRDHLLVFTGRGEREQQQINRVIDSLDGCISACNRLSWNGFVTAVRHASMLYGVESMAGHVAAAVGTPCTVIYTGTAGVARWRPEGTRCTVFTQHVPCAPCGIPSGCDHMTCIRSITPESILNSRL
jgi:ADP-heptose:LPS heptosyltransferase